MTTIDGITVLLQRDCLGGERVVEVRMPRGLQLDDLDRLGVDGRREVLTDLPRPFVRFDAPGNYLLTGIVSDPRVRFTVRLAHKAHALELALAACRSMLEIAG